MSNDDAYFQFSEAIAVYLILDLYYGSIASLI